MFLSPRAHLACPLIGLTFLKSDRNDERLSTKRGLFRQMGREQVTHRRDEFFSFSKIHPTKSNNSSNEFLVASSFTDSKSIRRSATESRESPWKRNPPEHLTQRSFLSRIEALRVVALKKGRKKKEKVSPKKKKKKKKVSTKKKKKKKKTVSKISHNCNKRDILSRDTE